MNSEPGNQEPQTKPVVPDRHIQSPANMNPEAENQEPAHPIRGLFLIIAAGLGLLWLTSKVAEILPWGERITIGENTFVVQWWVYVFPTAFLLVLALRAVDALAKGKLFEWIGGIITFGFPTFGDSLKELSTFYKNPQQQQHLRGKHPFSKWMVVEIVPKYENNVQALAYWGAAILIVLVGFRGIQLMSREDPSLLIAALLLEFLLISLLGFLMFYKPEETNRTHHSSNVGDILTEDLNALSESVRRLNKELDEKFTTLQNQITLLKQKKSPGGGE